MECGDSRNCERKDWGNPNCTHFYCEDGGNVTRFIDAKRKVCDGNEDCDTGIDECQHCTVSVFSSDDSMMSQKSLTPFLWIISILAVLGNLAVLGTSCHKFVTSWKKLKPKEKIHSVLLTNLSAADLLVGIYTLMISIQNVRLSQGRYCMKDQEWRSGSTCSAIGALLLTGSEQSVFILTIISAMRLRAVARPFANPGIRVAILLVVTSWTASILLAVIPLFPVAEDYFVERIWYKDNPLMSSVEKKYVYNKTIVLLDMLGTMVNDTSKWGRIGSWKVYEMLATHLNHTYIPKRRFGYYSAHGVCLPRFFANPMEITSWAYSTFLICLNFCSFFFIFGSYVAVYFIATKTNAKASKRSRSSSKLQRKITRIVVTDFLCWIPICIMAFLQLGGIHIRNELYVPVGTILIPINSCLNPFLFSELPDIMWNKISPIGGRLRASVASLWSWISQQGNSNETAGTELAVVERNNPLPVGSEHDADAEMRADAEAANVE